MDSVGESRVDCELGVKATSVKVFFCLFFVAAKWKKKKPPIGFMQSQSSRLQVRLTKPSLCLYKGNLKRHTSG